MPHCFFDAQMDIEVLAGTINGLPLPKAIESVSALKKMAEGQLVNQPRNEGFPVLIQRPQPIKLHLVKKNIENTVSVCDAILRILKSAQEIRTF